MLTAWGWHGSTGRKTMPTPSCGHGNRRYSLIISFKACNQVVPIEFDSISETNLASVDFHCYSTFSVAGTAAPPSAGYHAHGFAWAWEGEQTIRNSRSQAATPDPAAKDPPPGQHRGIRCRQYSTGKFSCDHRRCLLGCHAHSFG